MHSQREGELVARAAFCVSGHLRAVNGLECVRCVFSFEFAVDVSTFKAPVGICSRELIDQ